MKCNFCSKEVKEDQNFCPYCGKVIVKNDYSDIINGLDLLYKGANPNTGEIIIQEELFESESYCNLIYMLYKQLKRAGKLQSKSSKRMFKRDSNNLLNRDVNKIFKDLKEWRSEKAQELQWSAFMIFSNAELENIAAGDVCKKEDLLKVRGIAEKRYSDWGDEIFEVLKPYIKEDDEEKYKDLIRDLDY